MISSNLDGKNTQIQVLGLTVKRTVIPYNATAVASNTIILPSGIYITFSDIIARNSSNTHGVIDLCINETAVICTGRLPFTNGTHIQIAYDKLIFVNSPTTVYLRVSKTTNDGEALLFDGNLYFEKIR